MKTKKLKRTMSDILEDTKPAPLMEPSVEKYKSIVVQFLISEKEYEHIRKYYSMKEIKTILEEGGLGELSLLVSDKERRST